MRYAVIDAEIRKYSEKWYLDFEEVRYEAFHFRDGELANENKLFSFCLICSGSRRENSGVPVGRK